MTYSRWYCRKAAQDGLRNVERTLPSVQVVDQLLHFGTLMPLRVGASIPLLSAKLVRSEARTRFPPFR